MFSDMTNVKCCVINISQAAFGCLLQTRKKEQQEQNGLMELYGLKNTREKKTRDEREKCSCCFCLKLLLPRIKWRVIHQQQSIFYERLRAVPCNEAMALSSSLSYSLNHSGRSRLSRIKFNNIFLYSTELEI